MTTLQQWAESDTAPWTKINENVAALSASAIFSKRAPATTGLTWGFHGGLYNGNTIADGAVTLTNAATNYVVVLRSTGVVSTSTSSSNSTNPLYAKLYTLTVAGSVVTVEVDSRWDANGLLFNAGGGAVATDAIWDAAGDLVQGTGANTAARLPIGTELQVLRVNAGATALEWADIKPVEHIIIACSDEVATLTTGTAKVTFRMPYAFTITDVRASVTTAATGGTLLTVDVNESGASILSTKLTFDSSEKTTTTAATQRVISDTALADDAEITIDIDFVGSTVAGAGLKVALIGRRT